MVRPYLGSRPAEGPDDRTRINGPRRPVRSLRALEVGALEVRAFSPTEQTVNGGAPGSAEKS